MATTLTNSFVASVNQITITDEDGHVWLETGDADNHRDQVRRAVRREFDENGTTSGSIAITVS